MPLGEALYQIHFPQSPDKLNRAEYRLKFDELLGIQLNIQSRRTLRKTRYGRLSGFRAWASSSTVSTTSDSPSR